MLCHNIFSKILKKLIFILENTKILYYLYFQLAKISDF